MQGAYFPLSAAADGSRPVRQRTQFTVSGYTPCRERAQLRFQIADARFDELKVAFGDALIARLLVFGHQLGWCGHFAHQANELLLDRQDAFFQIRCGFWFATQHAHGGAQLVDGSVGIHPGVLLGDLSIEHQTGISLVADFRDNTHALTIPLDEAKTRIRP